MTDTMSYPLYLLNSKQDHVYYELRFRKENLLTSPEKFTPFMMSTLLYQIQLYKQVRKFKLIPE